MDDFLEQVAVRSRQGVYTFLYFFIWIFIVVLGVFALLNITSIIGVNESGGLQINFMAIGLALVSGGLAFLLFRRADYCRAEYDYTFTNGILDVSQVLNNKRRRYLTSLDLKTVLRCGPAKGPGFQKTLNEQGIKKHNWFLNRDGQLYYFYFTKNNIKHMAVLELTQEMVGLIRSKSYLQRGVWVSEDGKSDYNYGVSR